MDKTGGVADTGNTKNKENIKHFRQDGGWSWAVCFACFVVHVIFDGIYLSCGVVFVELLDHFDRSKRDTAAIVSLRFGVAFLCGEIAFVSFFALRRFQQFSSNNNATFWVIYQYY